MMYLQPVSFLKTKKIKVSKRNPKGGYEQEWTRGVILNWADAPNGVRYVRIRSGKGTVHKVLATDIDLER